ncbi:hypothetical protein GCM10010201_27990 [Pilimelia columellifera subsp. columellifera]|uniref:Uncharacterized protein n=1 Tax=Pilimelia columellifera subsp. columellifera TaxID=706583 RepID=A0ABN3NMT6_9ACTN
MTTPGARQGRRPLATAARAVSAVKGRALVGGLAVVAAIAAGAALLSQPAAEPTPLPTPGLGDVPMAEAWPGVTASAPQVGVLDDNTTYTPRLYLNTQLSVGIARTPDGETHRLLTRAADGRITELRRVAGSRDPNFNGFAASGDVLVWAETTTGGPANQLTTIWRADLKTGAVRSLTADTGNAVFRKSGFDVVIAEGAAHWVSGGNIKTIPAEVRSIPLAGGKVTRRTVPTLLSLSTWPWLTTAESAVSVPATIFNLKTGKSQVVRSSPSESIRCRPSWCRIGVVGSSGISRTDMMRPDGAERRRIAGPNAAAVMNDIGLFDRFEALGVSEGPEKGTITLQLVDLARQQTVRIAEGAAVVESQGSLLWWAEGLPGREYKWRALDLSAIPA